mmetsp:Transcript_38565/g.121526  ORF Transcript_38565/g.121526 Transcript_38565/m.121526 type:complete len:129 (-) Transcript_38565:273-659(-)
MASASEMVVAAFLCTLAVVLSILACVITTDSGISANWWPMFVVATYAIAPFPLVLFSKGSDGGMATYWAFFTTGWITTASFGIPAILAHSKIIALGNCFLSIAASLVFYGSAVGVQWYQARKESSFSF